MCLERLEQNVQTAYNGELIMARIPSGKNDSADTGMSPIALSCGLVILIAASSFGQDATGWQVKAGGKMSFDVASVKRSQDFRLPNIPLMSLDDAKPPGGRFSGFVTLEELIPFAYKLEPFETAEAFKHAPSWVRDYGYEIDAKAPGNPTKDQMRLMMQSLLADRFKFAVHFETRDLPVLALTLVQFGEVLPRPDRGTTPSGYGLDLQRVLYSLPSSEPAKHLRRIVLAQGGNH